jgi:MATE family multidrug resistance protein
VSAAQNRATHAQIWTMAWPIIVANVTVPLLGAVDTAVVGHLPEPYYIGAVAIGAMLFNYIYHLFNCLRMGTTGPTAQARGAGDHAEVRAMIGRALLLAGVIGGLIVMLQLPILAFAFWIIDASPNVEKYAREYFLIRVWGMPAVLGTYAIFGWLYGLRDVKTPLWLQVFVNLLNIVLALIFVFVLGWSVPGVAAASLIAEVSGLLLGLLAVRRALKHLTGDGKRSRVLDPVKFKRMLAINRDIVLRTICVVSVLGFFMAKSAELGDVQLAANQVLHHFLIFTSFALDGVAHAAETILGESVGKRDRTAFELDRQMVFLWSGVAGVINIAIYVLTGPALIALMTSIPEVREVAAQFLWWPTLMPLVSVWAYAYDGVYLAATRTRVMRNTMISAFMIFLILLYGLMPLIGNHALWLAVSGFLTGRGLLLHMAYPLIRRSF